ncbi:MAG: DUF4190 domain-containing protein [Planctomycetota bacterium]|nr:DUF4190 domain-containing protein [Planctomycetota bacterium]
MANSTADSSFTTSGLENELTGYKAVSGSAIFSAFMGVCSAFMFLDRAFFFVPLLAIYFGFTSLRRIQRYPDIYTGQKIAQSGIGLAVIFTLVSVAISAAYQMTLTNEVTSYSKSVEEVLRTKSAEELLFLKLPTSQRGPEVTPEKLAAERIEGGPEAKIRHDNEMKPLRDIIAARNVPGADISFKGIELAGYDKLTPFAFALFNITGPEPAHDHKDGEEHDHSSDSKNEPRFAMVEIKAEKIDGKFSWYIAQLHYPYKRGTAQVKSEKVDDGHGH